MPVRRMTIEARLERLEKMHGICFHVYKDIGRKDEKGVCTKCGAVYGEEELGDEHPVR